MFVVDNAPPRRADRLGSGLTALAMLEGTVLGLEPVEAGEERRVDVGEPVQGVEDGLEVFSIVDVGGAAVG